MNQRLEKGSPQAEPKRTFPSPWPRAGHCSPSAELCAHPHCHTQTILIGKKSWKRGAELTREAKKPNNPLFAGAQQKREGRARQPHQACLGWEKQYQLHPRKCESKFPHPRLSSRAGPQFHMAAPWRAGSCIPQFSEAVISS